MGKHITLNAALAAAGLALWAGLAAAQPADQPRRSEPIYGYRMMNDAERNEYREKMRTARSTEERQALRDEHRKLMESRAKERGITLPEARGPGRGPGPGPGGQAGPGAGRGPGAGMPGKGPGAGRGGPRPDCPGAADCPGPGAGPGGRKPAP